MVALLVADRIAFAQAGSTGGTIGKTDKSISGSEETPVSRRNAPPAKPAPAFSSSRPTGAANSCTAIVGTWQWFNGEEAVFKMDGAAHTATNTGTWTCSGGSYVVSWSVGGWIDRLRISTDNTRIDGTNGFIRVSGIRK
jgi:hypothetical protein